MNNLMVNKQTSTSSPHNEQSGVLVKEVESRRSTEMDYPVSSRPWLSRTVLWNRKLYKQLLGVLLGSVYK